LRRRWEEAIATYQSRLAQLEQLAKDDWKLSAEALTAARQSRELQAQEVRNSLAEAYALLPQEGPVAGAKDAPPTPTGCADLGQGVATLLVTRGADAWFAFLCARGKLHIARLQADTALGAAADVHLLQAQLGAALANWQRQQVLQPGALLRTALHPLLQRVDVHALLLGNEPLAAQYLVTYALDESAPGGASTASPSLEPKAVLIVGDPNLDLPNARLEAEQLAGRFEGARSLLGEAATEANVRRDLSTAQLLHFAGHAEYGGIDGVDSILRFASGERLELGEVLALRTVPGFVVLSACEAAGSNGQQSTGLQSGGLSIGQAFLAAGSSVVVAPNRTLPDREGHQFTTTLYRNLLGNSEEHWARAVQAAWQDLRDNHPGSDWASFRMMTP
jgi:hypothetical protein